jgi:ABC-2 type transport system ATP-binding protein
VIEVAGLIKRYGSKVAVGGLDFEIQPGRVTGFLGPNGSGKSTTMRCMVGLDHPDAGETRFDGQTYRALESPLRHVGTLLDASYLHPTRKARLHLKAVAASNGIAGSRIDEVLAMVGLADVAGSRPKTYSLGMRQRLGLAAALLGDPKVLILDEPANGLDPEGIRWIRDFLSYLAKQGRSIFVSSHLLSEMALMADHLVVIGQGRLIEEGSSESFISRYADRWVTVRSPQAARLAELIRAAGANVSVVADAVEVRGATAMELGEMAAKHGIVLHELSPQSGSLEDAFLELTRSTQEYRAVAPPGASPPAPIAGPPVVGSPSRMPPPPPPPAPGGPFGQPPSAGAGR